jgi:hypothetical protein
MNELSGFMRGDSQECGYAMQGDYPGSGQAGLAFGTPAFVGSGPAPADGTEGGVTPRGIVLPPGSPGNGLMDINQLSDMG